MGNQEVIQPGLQAEQHRHVATGRDRVGDVGCSDDSDVGFPGEHGLGGATGDDKDELRIEAILSEEPLFLCEPQRNRVPAHGPIHERKPGRSFSGVRLCGAQDKEAS